MRKQREQRVCGPAGNLTTLGGGQGARARKTTVPGAAPGVIDAHHGVINTRVQRYSHVAPSAVEAWCRLQAGRR